MTERLKTALLILLGAAAILLAALNWFRPARSPGAESSSAPTYAEPAELSAAAEPILLTQRRGEERRGAFYDQTELRAAMNELAQALTEAMGSAAAPESIWPAVWRTALGRDGVCLSYAEPMPLTAIAAWYAADCAVVTPVRHLLLTADEEGALWLYYQDEAGGYARCKTASRAALPELMLTTDCRYAMEQTEVIGAPEAMTLLTDSIPCPALLSVTDIGSQEEFYPLLRALGIHPQTPFVSTGSDGTVRYVDLRRQCMISRDGAVYYSSPLTVAADEDPVALLETDTDWLGYIESCRRLLTATADIVGDAEWTLLSIERQGSRYRLHFGLRIGSIPLHGGAYAGFVIDSGRLTELQMQVRRYTKTEETRPLPMDTALALARGRAYRLSLLYPDEGGALLVPVWAAG